MKKTTGIKKEKAVRAAFAAVFVLFAVLCVFAGAGAGATPAHGVDGGIAWSISEGGTLTISPAGEDKTQMGYFSGQMKGYVYDSSGYSTAPWMPSKGSLKKLVINEGVTTIGGYAFYGCSGFTGDLVIPNSVTTIGGSAFDSCSGFVSLTIGNSVTTILSGAFYNCRGFTGSLTIPDSVVMIGDQAFRGCYGFTNLTIGNSVEKIDIAAFYDCGFTKDLVIPNSVEKIGAGAFSCCISLPAISVSTGNAYFTSINGVLYDIEQTTLICCPAGKTGTFDKLEIPTSVAVIGAGAFAGCSGFTGSLTIPDHVTTIGSGAFSGCSGFTGSLTIPDCVTIIDSETFDGCRGFTGSLAIPDSVTMIGNFAFRHCSGFTGSLAIPDSVTMIGRSAFRDCSGFTGSLAIPDSVTTIGNFAFDGCRGFSIIYTAERYLSLIDVAPVAVTNGGIIKNFQPKPMLATPVKAGYTFDGWYKNAEFTGIRVEKYTESDWYYAKWTETPSQEHSVTVNSDGGGTGMATPSTASPGTTVVLSSNPATGYIFKEWQVTSGTISIVNNQFIMPTENITIKAVFEELPGQQYMVSVQNDGHGTGTATPSPAVPGATITLSSAPATYYMFKEWEVISGTITIENNQFTMPAENVTIKAVFGEDPAYQHTVTVQSEGQGTGTATPSTAVPGTTVVLSNTHASGYQFKEWQVTPDTVTITNNQFTMPSENVRVKAVFESSPTQQYTITYNGNGNTSGTVPASPAAYDSGTSVTVLSNIGNLAKDGFAFDGWNTKTDGTGTNYTAGSSLTVTADVTLYAKWKQIEPEPIHEDFPVEEDEEGHGTSDIEEEITNPEAKTAGASVELADISGIPHGEATFVQVGETVVELPSGEEIKLILSAIDITPYNGTEKVSNFSTPVTITFKVTLPTGSLIQNLVVEHHNGTVWENISYAVLGYDSATREYTIGVSTDTFSPFVLGLLNDKTIYTITGKTEGSGTLSLPSSAAEGETVAFSANAASGYALKSISVKGDESGEDIIYQSQSGVYSFTMPSENVTVKAIFRSSGGSGGNSSSQPEGTVWASSTPILTATAAPTATPTPVPPQEVPSVKPIGNSTQPGKSPMPFLGILAGLGAAALLFAARQRR